MSENITVDAAKVRAHTAIRFGALKALGLLLLTTAGLACFTIAIWPYNTGTIVDRDFGSRLLVGTLSLVTFAILGFQFVQFFPKFFRRNISGYTLWVYRDADGSFGTHLVRAWIRPNFGMAHVVMGLPLGGWFNRGKVRGVSALLTTNDMVLVCWRVKLVAINGPGEVTVRLIDKNGDGVTLAADLALRILDDFCVKPFKSASRQPIKTTWAELTPYLAAAYADHDAAVAKAKELEKEVGKLSGDRDQLRVTLLYCVREIRATSRFSRSREARGIRKLLIEEILKLLPGGDDRRPELESDLKEIDAALEREQRAKARREGSSVGA